MIYNRLLTLYKKCRNTDKTPLEDFTTEILVGILDGNAELLSLLIMFLKLMVMDLVSNHKLNILLRMILTALSIW